MLKATIVTKQGTIHIKNVYVHKQHISDDILSPYLLYIQTHVIFMFYHETESSLGTVNHL